MIRPANAPNDRDREHGSSRSTHLGRAVRQRRKLLGVTQTELAELAGCGLTFVSQLEAGKETLKLDKVLDVLEALGLGLTVQGKPHSTPDADE